MGGQTMKEAECWMVVTAYGHNGQLSKWQRDDFGVYDTYEEALAEYEATLAAPDVDVCSLCVVIKSTDYSQVTPAMLTKAGVALPKERTVPDTLLPE
jgi:hypothetical protein